MNYIKFLLAIFISILVLSCANRAAGPTGGLKDTIPPVVIRSIPLEGVVNYKKKEILVYFNENITLGAGEDIDLWIRIALKYPIAFCNQVTAIHNLESDNRISNSNTNQRQFIDLDAYENDAKTKASLKKYLDLNRFAFAIQYKLAGNIEKAESLIGKIDDKNLNIKQRALLKLNGSGLKLALKFKRGLQNSGILLSSFR